MKITTENLTLGMKVIVHYYDPDEKHNDYVDHYYDNDYVGIVTALFDNCAVVRYLPEEGDQAYDENVKTFKYYPPQYYLDDGEWVAENSDITLYHYKSCM